MTQEIFNKILSDHKELSSLPQVLMEVLKVASDPNSSAGNLAAIIMKDPALTAKLLRIVNSPHYGPVTKITTVNQAVVILGLRTVTAIALSSSLYDKINKVNATIDRKRFWRHSLEVAIAAKMIAEATGYQPAEEAFVAGMLHEIGTLVLEASFPAEFRRIWKLVEIGENQLALEERTWGTNHARVGQFLLEQWNVPRIIGEAVGSHHAVFSPNDKTADHLLAQIVNLANQISRFRVYNMPPPESKMLENRDLITSNLGLSNAALARFEECILNEVIRESGYLEIEIGSMEEIFQESNRLLFKQYIAVENLLRENRIMQQQIARDQAKRAALESLKMVSAIFSHHLENANNVILERTHQLESALNRGEIVDKTGVGLLSAEAINEAVETVSMILDELKKMATFESTMYNDDSYLPDIETKIRQQLDSIKRVGASA
jgi:HD-like signal output (HDOD) protein